MNVITVYKSKFGSSKQYACWISEALQCDVADIGNVTLNQLQAYDIIIHVGGLYAGSIHGFKFIKKHLEVLDDKKILLCMVGMTPTNEKEIYDQIYCNHVPESHRDHIVPFALRGNQNYSEMSAFHRLMMKVPKAQVKKIPQAQRTEDQQSFLNTFGKDIRYVRQDYVNSIVAYVNACDQ